MAYPIWASYKAIESPQPDDDTQWLTYWVIFAIFTFGENFSDFIIGWFPMYYTFKFMLMILLQLPQLRIPSYIYVTHVRPRLKQKEGDIDQFLADTSSNIKKKTVSLVTSQFTKATANADIQTTVAAAVVQQVIQPHGTEHQEISQTKED
eukprot:Phypoly_transcript_16104.p1 GENE.Phypoly_transcript_16104~~Phypoly_transcript_16104.p1  ORF type:complete len:150 (+),score=15.83 Phypoly_transcript_16104:1-450(+)